MPDLVLITTLIVSIGDVLVNIIGFCCAGRIRANCCGDCFSIEKDDDDTQKLTKEEVTAIEDAVRRGSVHANSPIHNNDK